MLIYRGDDVFEVELAGSPPLPQGRPRLVLAGIDASRMRHLDGDTFLAVRPPRPELPGRALHLVLSRPTPAP